MVTSDARQLSDLFRCAGVSAGGGESVPDTPVRAIENDSRTVTQGACFVAVRGGGVDGHDFVADALARGATSVVYEQDREIPGEVTAVRVDDSRDALAKLAACFHGQRGAGSTPLPLVGITGTNGKTTIAWMLRAILGNAGLPAALVGTIEYDLVSRKVKAPLTTPGPVELAKLLHEAQDAGARFGVLEVSSHALEQRRCDGLSFSMAIFTNLSGDHLDYHGSMEAYFNAKRRLFDLLERGGAAIINTDDPRGVTLAKDCRPDAIRYGLESSADVTGTIEAMNQSGTTLRIQSGGCDESVRLSLVGKHNASNVLAAFAAARSCGLSVAEVVQGLEGIRGVPGRLERVECPGRKVSVFVDYAHTDDALRNALRAVRPLTEGRLICVFGCGGDRDRTKRPRMAAAAAEAADVAVVTSDNPRTEDPMQIIEDILPGFEGVNACAVEVNADRRAAIALAMAMAEDGDAILIAGKGHEDYQLIGDRVLTFDDAKVAQEVLSENAVAEDVA
jgi:UDP-N-acetylmuramoyl-L-alanyl-D-glutamate--2,6-diaminopimelate ligase